MSDNVIRFGIIGFGNIGSMHAANLFKGKIPRATLAAICDSDKDKLAKAGAKYPSIMLFDSYETMFASGAIDAVIIAIPHYFHHTAAIKAFANRLHVLTEKPAGVRPSDVKEMNAAAKVSGKVFGIMFNQRTNPLFSKARELVRSGKLGKPKRLSWTVTNWYRTQSYYDSGSWRATWQGEGGGVLTNQAPHNLDIAQWIFGMPCRVRGFCEEGRYHNIAVEDYATLYGEYENGATLQFTSTTGEYPGTNRLEIMGEGGKIVIEDGKLKLWLLKESEKELRFSSRDGMPSIPYEYTEMTQDAPETAHCGIIENFTSAILDGTPLLAPGEEGLHQVLLTTGAYLSSWLGKMVELPIDDELYNRCLEEKAKKEEAKQGQNDSSEKEEDMLPRWSVNWS